MSSVLTEKISQSAESDTSNANIYGFPYWITLGVIAGVVLVFGSYRMYLNEYAFTVGLDYFEPEFQTYWMTLFYIQIPVLITIGVTANAWLWFSRNSVQEMSPEKELGIYMKVMAFLLAFGIGFGIVFSLFTEADAAWHQVTIRDTDFTPTHILLFYFLIPVMIISLATGFMWLHTRLPDFRDRISLPFLILIVGIALMLPNVGFNEWGHTFFYAEELFAAPIHWGFVTLGWAFFAIAGLLVQFLDRIRLLTRVISEPKPAETSS